MKKREQFQEQFEFFASCLPGFEAALADELHGLRVRRVRPLNGGVAFFGDAVAAERVCLWSRVASRVTLVVGRVNAGDAELLYAGCYRLPWASVVAPGASVAVRAHGTNSELRNTQFSALKVKDALCDSLRESTGTRPNVDASSPDVLVDVRIRDARATVSVDLAGESLHRRAYFDGRDGEDAPLACAQAAGLLVSAGAYERLAQGWGVIDPACDAGFVVCEAAGIAADLAPGLVRERWGFFGWAQHDDAAWSALLDEADERFERGLARLLQVPAEGAQAGAGVGPAAEVAVTSAASSAAPDTERVRIVGLSTSSPSIARARDHLRAAGLRAVASVEAASADDAACVVDRVSGIVRRGASVACDAGARTAAPGEGALADAAAPVEGTLASAAPIASSAADSAFAADAGEDVLASAVPGEVFATDSALEENAGEDADVVSDVASGELAPVGAASDDAPVEGTPAGFVHAAAAPSEPTAVIVAHVVPNDRDESDARAIAEAAAYMAAVKRVPAGSVFASISGRGMRARFGIEPHLAKTVGAGRIASSLEVYDAPPAALVSIRVPDSAGGADHIVEVNDANAEQFASRLRKVAKERRKWARRANVSCYRVYDADLPDYAVAIDVYEGALDCEGKTFVHVAEYRAPASIDEARARRRFDDVLALVPVVLGVRPDHVFSKVRERAKGGSQYRNAHRRSYVAYTTERGLVFEVDLAGYLDTGIFLDHRETRAMVGDMAYGTRFLNLFAYTGTASAHAAAGGAVSTTTVDLSQTYLDWARRNMELNGFECALEGEGEGDLARGGAARSGRGRGAARHVLVRADVMSWIRDARRRREAFDLIFVDPPTFSNSKAMGSRTWDVQRDHVELLIGVSRLLTPGGVAVFSCNLRTFKPDVEGLLKYGVEIENVTGETIPHDFERNPRIHQCYLVRRVRQELH